MSNQCRGLDGKCGASSEFCNATETPHEVVLHRGFPEQNTTLPLWKPCCKDDGIERSVLRRDESKKWTSYCSHVFCQSKQLRNTHNQSFLDLTVVHHDNDERNGQKHVCKHGLHEHDKCGCECYGQEFGDQDIEELVDANITHFNPTCQITYFRCEANSTVVEDAAVLAEWKTGDASVSECATATEKRWQTCGGNGSVVSYIYTDMYDNTTKGGFGQNDREIGSLWYNSTRHHSVRTEGKPLRETEWVIPDQEIEVLTTKDSGPGGQHRNKTESAVIMKHRPTGIKVKASAKSQHQNRKSARAMLERRVAELRKQGQIDQHNATRRNQVGSGMRGDKVRTYRTRDNRVVDDRTGRKVSLKKVLQGELNLFD